MTVEKTLYDISWQVDEPTYRADPALSYSTIARYEKNGRFNSLPTLFDKLETPSLTFGSMVDTLITGSEEEFRKLFIVVDNPGLSESLLEITQRLYSLHREEGTAFDDLTDEELASIGKECNYYAGDKYANYRIKLIRENCKPYYNTLCIAEGKKVVSQEDVDDARRCVQALKTNPYTAFCFAENDPFDQTIQRFYQLKFKDSHDGVDYRCMMDLVIVNNKDKTIQPYDLKTSSHNEWDFPKSFQEYMYQLQARLYWRTLRANIMKDPVFSEYTLLPYKFVVVNRKNCKPLVWDFAQTDTVGQIEIITKSGYHIVWRDPYEIGKELNGYLKGNYEYPMGTKESQDIARWLRFN